MMAAVATTASATVRMRVWRRSSSLWPVAANRDERGTSSPIAAIIRFCAGARIAVWASRRRANAADRDVGDGAGPAGQTATARPDLDAVAGLVGGGPVGTPIAKRDGADRPGPHPSPDRPTRHHSWRRAEDCTDPGVEGLPTAAMRVARVRA